MMFLCFWRGGHNKSETDPSKTVGTARYIDEKNAQYFLEMSWRRVRLLYGVIILGEENRAASDVV